jgi:molybdate transport system substrate-binding protein
MNGMRPILLALLLASSAAAAAPVTVTALISGGFSRPYNAAVPGFENSSGVTVQTGTGASEGDGPATIRYQLAHGARADLVILSRSGLDRLEADGLIRPGSAVPLATAPLAAAVRTGSPRPDIATAAAFKQALIGAGQIVMPGSTSGIFVRDQVFPKLELPPNVTLTLMARGAEAIQALKDKKADLIIGPVSEITHQSGLEIIGLLPPQFQLVQTFAAAITRAAEHPDDARRLIIFLASDAVTPAIHDAGMARPGQD